MVSEKIDMTHLFNKFLTNYKQKHVIVNGHQAKMFKNMAWNKERKREYCKIYIVVENESRKAKERFSRNFFLPKTL